MSLKKTYSFNTKITLSFIILGLFLLSILFILIIPNMQEEQKKAKKSHIEHMITLTNEQLKLAVELLIRSSISKRKDIKNLINENKKLTEICELKSLEEVKEKLSQKEFTRLKQNELVFYFSKQKHMCPKAIDFVYYLNKNNNTIIKCNPKKFENRYITLEENIKNNLQKSFQLTKQDHKGKINLIWINTKHKDFDNKPLYNKLDKPFNTKYCLSKMSSSKIPQTGKLTAKQIVEAADKKPIYHMLNTKENPKLFNKPTFTWVKTLHDLPERKQFFLTTIYEEDFNKDLASPLLKILPAAISSFIIAIILGFFIFKKLFKSINILTNTAKEVNNGNINLRSELKGDNDIALLGKAFDNMLDSIEENINNLDKKVEEKTKELSTSLKEKEVLLKEIHHRVKNNLAMTINLIKLQKSKIEDENTKAVLIDIQERIFTMELLHRKLYESKDLNSIPFKKYVKELCSDLNKTYKNSRDININCDVENININIEYALPCGIIITECLTNAYKYAFKNQKGQISIKFKKKQNTYFLIIMDNGIGLPQNIDINKTKSLGLRLVSSIVKGQLNGHFEYTYQKGSIFKINFEV